MDYLFSAQEYLNELSEYLATELKDVFEIKHFNKNHLILRQGEHCQAYYFLKSGILRNFYLKEGIEVTTSLTFPNDVTTNMRSILLKEPSLENIQIVTKAEVYELSIETLNALKQEHPKIEQAINTLSEYYILWLEDRLSLLQFHTATERYNLLLEREPILIHTVPLSYLASYLGISGETLSRIRAKM